MSIVVDTNRYVDFARGEAEAVETIRRAHRVYVPFVVVGGLRAAFLCGSKTQRNEANLTRFLSAPRVELLFADEDTTHHYARLFRQLRTQGTPIPTNDLWTAALTIQHGAHLFARDRHFETLPQIPRA